MRDRGAADLVAVAAGADAGGRVDDQVHLAALDPVEHVRGALAELVQRLHRHAHARDRLGRAARGEDPKAVVVQRLGDARGGRLVFVGDRDEGGAAARQRHPGGGLGLGERRREVAGDAHHLAGRAHLRPQQRVGALEAVERQHRLLDRHVAAEAEALALGGQAEGLDRSRRA